MVPHVQIKIPIRTNLVTRVMLIVTLLDDNTVMNLGVLLHSNGIVFRHCRVARQWFDLGFQLLDAFLLIFIARIQRLLGRRLQLLSVEFFRWVDVLLQADLLSSSLNRNIKDLVNVFTLESRFAWLPA